MLKEVTIYTDGACSGNPGPGGWGAILLYGERRLEISGGEPQTTNNRMEILAAIRALERLREPCRVSLFSDSSYLVDAFNKGWLANWQRQGWQRGKNSPVKNRDLWLVLLELCQMHSITWHWVKGHAANIHNNRCDHLARSWIAEHYRS